MLITSCGKLTTRSTCLSFGTYVTVQTTKTDVVPVRTVEVVNNTVNVPLQVHSAQPLIH